MTAQLWVFAGPNGAGKSTLVAQHVRGRIPIVNPDDIARDLTGIDPPFNSPRTDIGRLIKAGRAAVVMREGLLKSGKSFGIETTLTGRSELDLMRRAQTAGYRINVVFVGLEDADLSAARVHSRVQRGGHDVPMVDVLRRYSRSMDHLAIALMIADRAFVFDNSGPRRRLLLFREAGRTKHLSQLLPEWAASAIPSDMQQKPGGTRGR
ncbi:AAA family ATPase [Acidisoma silvae]|uniref:AAA family ATPase n=1 Tax=Acidisoma silvae TaxID=2802396 RepID=A0A964E165_9PROT|nr:AAA family ATPase [Acidisoma silvae]MCB8877458.1 AAA family ATPase [Acidisoma silvae]